MYGLVNQSFYSMIIDNYGLESWNEIKKFSGVDIEIFISNHPYEDNLTYELIGAATEVLKKEVNHLLEEFGEYWILNTGAKKYGELMKAGGEHFSSFINNLPRFHDRIILIYPEMKPPEFKVSTSNNVDFILDYYSERQGLTYFVIGLLKGIAIMFSQKIEVTLLNSEFNTIFHDSFSISVVN
jgi:hypothetical protein